jgi:hypothetical protein
VIKGLLARDFTKRIYFEPEQVGTPNAAAPAGGSPTKPRGAKYNLRTLAFYADIDFPQLLKKQVRVRCFAVVCLVVVMTAELLLVRELVDVSARVLFTFDQV